MLNINIVTVSGLRTRAWPTAPDKEPGAVNVESFKDALFSQHDDDRYLVGYFSTGPEQRRLKNGSPILLREQGFDVLCRLAFLDIDYKSVELTPENRAWFVEQWQNRPDWCAMYQTPFGYRICYMLAQPVSVVEIVKIQEALARRIDAPVDTQCLSDWTRLMRAPYSLYKDSGHSTWDLCDPNVLWNERYLDPSTLDLVDTRANKEKEAVIHGEFVGRPVPSFELLREECIGQQRGFKEKTDAHHLYYRAKKLTTNMASAPKQVDQEAGIKNLALLEMLECHAGFSEERNNSINRVTFLLANYAKRNAKKALREVVPERVFSVMAASLTAMDEDPNCSRPGSGERAGTWYEHGWAVCCEAASKINAENKKTIEEGKKEVATVEDASEQQILIGSFLEHNKTFKVAEGLRDWREDEGKTDALYQSICRYAIVNLGPLYWYLQEDGSYTNNPLLRDGVRNHLRIYGSSWGVSLKSFNEETGRVMELSSSQICLDNSYELLAHDYVFKDSTEGGGSVNFKKPRFESMVTTSSYWNETVMQNPEYSPDIQDFLYHLCGCDQDTFGKLLVWLAHFQDMSVSLPMLVLTEKSRSGKSFLGHALQDLFNVGSLVSNLPVQLGVSKEGRPGSGQEYRQPFFLADEGIVLSSDEKINSGSKASVAKKCRQMATRFKELITTSRVETLKLYSGNNAVFNCRPRLMSCDNANKDIPTLLSVHDDTSTWEESEAVENRILGIRTGQLGKDWMSENSIKAKTEFWVHTNHPNNNRDGFQNDFDNHPKAYLFARHIAWLHLNKDNGVPIGGKWVPSSDFIEDSKDSLLIFKRTSYVAQIQSEGSTNKDRLMDKIVMLIVRTLGREAGTEYTNRDSRGAYYDSVGKKFLVTGNVLQAMFEDEDFKMSRTTRQAAFELTKWGFEPFTHQRRGLMQVMYGGEVIQIDNCNMRQIKASEVVHMLKETNSITSLELLATHGIVTAQ